MVLPVVVLNNECPRNTVLQDLIQHAFHLEKLIRL